MGVMGDYVSHDKPERKTHNKVYPNLTSTTAENMPIRKVSRNTRLKWTQVGFAIFQATFAYYRLSRNLLLSLPRHFSRHKITMAMMRIRRAIQAVISTTTTSRWSDELPEEIMQLILQRLCLPDYIRCGAVCRS
ncbi:hypothetical protein ACE6H2_012497 [Prunus campanulata]